MAAADDATNAAGEGVGVRVQVRSMRAGPRTRDGGAGTGERNDAPRRVQARVPGARILPDATRRTSRSDGMGVRRYRVRIAVRRGRPGAGHAGFAR